MYETINRGPFAGIAGAGPLGMTNAFLDFLEALTKQLIPASAAQFYKTVQNRFDGDAVLFPGQNISSYFYDGDNIIIKPTIAKYFTSNARIGRHGVPSMPLFVYKEVANETRPSPIQMLLSISSTPMVSRSRTSGMQQVGISYKLLPAFWMSSISFARALLVLSSLDAQFETSSCTPWMQTGCCTLAVSLLLNY